MSFLSILLSAVTNPRSLRALAGLLILALVWFGCSALGIYGTKRLLVVAGVLLLVVGVQVLLAMRTGRKRTKAAADLETSMIMEADQSVASADAGEKRAREEARRELVAAIEVLKRSQLADGRGGKAALYVLPWYLVLGNGYSGKSGVIRNSGLQPPDKGPGELRGIGASTNCEWWFTNHAVLLEADGRFAATSGAKAAERDWETFLATLHKQRPRIPLNGVVLTVSAADLMQGTAGEAEAQAKLLRRRLDAIADQLKLVFPVYLVVTKLDLVQGFDDYFAGLAGAGSEQVFGCTLRAAHMRGANLGRVVAAEFGLLYQAMRRRCQMRLVQDEHRARVEGTYLFPLEMRALGGNLQRFVQVLCEPNAYGRNPLLRGFYFTSAGGEGEPTDLVLHETARMLGLPAPAAPPHAPGQPLFLRDFFRRVLVPDRDIARPTRGAARRMHLMRRGLQYASLAAVAALAVLLTVSFARNLSLVRRTRDLAVSAATVVPSEQRGLGYINDPLARLDELQAKLAELDRTDRRHGPALGFGLYRGERVNEAARRVYLDRFNTLVVSPYLADLEFWLRKTRPGADQFGEFFSRYKTYRMLLNPSHGDPDVMVPVMQEMLKEDAKDGTVRPPDEDRLARHLRFALRHPDELEAVVRNSGATLDPNLDRDAGDYITANWQIDSYYQEVIDGINKRRPELAFDLSKLGPGSGALDITDDPDADALHQVPPAFTLLGWQEETSKVFGNKTDLLKDDWLLPESIRRELPQRQGQLLSRYVKDYEVNWQRFLTSIVLESPSSLGGAERQLHALLEEDSLYRRLIAEAVRNLSYSLSEKDFTPEAATAMNGITRDFGALLASGHDGKDGKKPLDQFMDSVRNVEAFLKEKASLEHEKAAADFTRKIFEAGLDESSEIAASLAEAKKQCAGPEVTGDPDCNRAFMIYLRRPALAAWQSCLRETEQHLNDLWGRQVATPFKPLQGKYPLATDGVDMGLDEFGNFFGPGGTLQKFFSEDLAPYLEVPGYLPRRIHGEGLQLTTAARESLNRGARLREVMFSGDSSTPAIDFKVRPVQSRVEGQGGLAVQRTVFLVGRQRLVYEQGTRSSQKVTWPPNDNTGTARIETVLIGSDETPQVEGGGGDWALFRLIAKAEQTAPATPNFTLTWKIRLKNKPGSVVVPYEFAMGRSEHAFLRGLFAYDCPGKLFP